jgi:hypothetical protein
MLFIICEGETEALFVSRVLNPDWLKPQGKEATPIPLGGVPEQFPRLLSPIQKLLRNPQARVTTLIDYYGTPSGYPGMPHRPSPVGNPAAVLGDVTRMEAALANAVNCPRFIPHYALHEFESLAFADPQAISDQRKRLPGGSVLAAAQQMLARAQGNPEFVNDGKQTSPSHRLESLWPKKLYQKTVDSIGIVRRIPFGQMQEQCRHFDAWTRLL